MGAVPVFFAVGATVLVVAAAIVTLRSHTPSGAGSAGGIRGEVVDRDGHVLARSSSEITYLQIDRSKASEHRGGAGR